MSAKPKMSFGNRNRNIDWGLVATGVLAGLIISAQVRYLAVDDPSSDEGVFRWGGLLMSRGFVPHSDFPLWHLPLLPACLGVASYIGLSAPILRVLLGGVMCLASLPLYLSFKRLLNNRLAALAAVPFFLLQDFTAINIRPLATLFLIGFLFFATNSAEQPLQPFLIRPQRIMQGACVLLSALLFVPAPLNCALLALADGMTRRAQRRAAPKLGNQNQPDVAHNANISTSSPTASYVVIFALAFVAIAMYLSFMPHAFQQIVLDQLQRPDWTPRRIRLVLLWKDSSRWFYLAGIVGLIAGMIVLAHVRWWCAAMLGIIFINVFLSSNYFPSYPTGASLAFAFGVATGIVALQTVLQTLAEFRHKQCHQDERYQRKTGVKMQWPAVAAIALALFLLAKHSRRIEPKLCEKWVLNREPGYLALVEALRTAPQPILVLEPSYLASAGKLQIVPQIEPIVWRAPRMSYIHITRAQWQQAQAQACTIVLEKNVAVFIVPQDLQRQWKATHRIAAQNSWGIVLISKSSSCR